MSVTTEIETPKEMLINHLKEELKRATQENNTDLIDHSVESTVNYSKGIAKIRLAIGVYG
jgi:hypothetical protein